MFKTTKTKTKTCSRDIQRCRETITAIITFFLSSPFVLVETVLPGSCFHTGMGVGGVGKTPALKPLIQEIPTSLYNPEPGFIPLTRKTPGSCGLQTKGGKFTEPNAVCFKKNCNPANCSMNRFPDRDTYVGSMCPVKQNVIFVHFSTGSEGLTSA